MHPGTEEFANLVRSRKILEESWQDVFARILQAVLEDVLKDVVKDSCKLLQNGLVRCLISCKIGGFFQPGFLLNR